MKNKPWGLAVKAIIRDRARRCLAVRRTLESTHYPGEWDLPGGKVDAGESFDEALLREVMEETGLRVELTGVVGAGERALPKVRSVLLVVEARLRSGRLQLSAEHDEFRWVSAGELSRMKWSEEIRPVAEAIAAKFRVQKRKRAGEPSAKFH